MNFFDELEAEGVTDEQMKDFAKGTEPIKPGKYHVRLDGANGKTAAMSGNEGTELTFTLLNGADAGREVKETLWHSGKDETATKKMKGRAILFGAKLGLLKKNKSGVYLLCDGLRDLSDCLGNECVIELTNEEYVNKQGKKGIATRMTWAGIWSCDEPEARGVVKKSATAGQATAAKVAAKKFDASEL